jgi:radical SAM superfamily enzyme YgiQ (UPF0313 family)
VGIKKQNIAFEQGPIRPPSEARSLLLRLTRNCPWNKCTFCPVYKGTKFSRRDVDEIKGDIDVISDIANDIRALSWKMGDGGEVTDAVARSVFFGALGGNPQPKYLALWLHSGAKNVFLQDANSLVMKPDEVCEILTYLRGKFKDIDRITTYARSATVARMTIEDLKMLREAGLTRVHIGLESGSDEVLEFMKKGVTSAQHITGGRNVIEAGLELSEYIMPGLGGRKWTKEHARETARVLNEINPNFIRIRTLHVHPAMPLYNDVVEGRFELLSDDEVISEIRLLVEGLSGIESVIVSDHILNLLEEVEGKLPDDKEYILDVIDRYLSLDESERLLYKIGRRAGVIRSLEDLLDLSVKNRIETIKERLGISDIEGSEDKIREMMNGYI